MQVTDPHQDRRGQQQQHRAVVLVIGNPQAPELSVLEQLPPGAQVLAVAQTFQELSHLSEEQWCSIDVVCKMGGGKMGGGSIPPTSTPNTISSTCAAAAGKSAGDGRNNSGVGSAAVAGGSGSETSDKVWHGVQAHIHRCNSSSVSLTQSLEEFWPKLSGLKWLHTATVGTEHLLTPELVNSAVTVTNARGVYSHSLAEFVIMACLFFAKGLPQYLSAQAARRWEMFEVEELRGATLGIIGFGSIGRAVAEMAHVHQMRVVALRRHPEQSQQELADGLLAEVLPREHLHQLLAQSDYVVLATPHSPDTHRMVDAAAIAAMKPNAVLINVGRGKCIDEAALVAGVPESPTGTVPGSIACSAGDGADQRGCPLDYMLCLLLAADEVSCRTCIPQHMQRWRRGGSKGLPWMCLRRSRCPRAAGCGACKTCSSRHIAQHGRGVSCWTT